MVSSKPPGAKENLLPLPSFSHPVRYLEEAHQISELARVLSGVSRFGVDVESDSYYHYFEKVCLLQITVEGKDYIVDPLSARDLSPLKPAFADPSIEKIFHAAGNDMALLERSHGLIVSGIFDTMVAARIVGHRKFGLNNLVGHYFGYRLDKRYQRQNWSARPLSPAHLDYARGDTHFLTTLRDMLWDELSRLGRTSHAREEFRLVEAKKIRQKVFSPEDCLKIRGASKLAPDRQRILRELFLLRDRRARQRDVPPVRIMNNETLLALAEEMPRSRGNLSSVRGLHPRLERYLGAEILAAIERGIQSDAPPPRRTIRAPRPPADPDADTRFGRLKTWRAEKARQLDVDPDIVAPNAILHAVARRAPTELSALQEIPEVRDWQVEAFGKEWISTMALPE